MAKWQAGAQGSLWEVVRERDEAQRAKVNWQNCALRQSAADEAAHEVKAHSEADLLTALDVVEYLFKGVYILPGLGAKVPKECPSTSTGSW
jgi:hypothetical protein